MDNPQPDLKRRTAAFVSEWEAFDRLPDYAPLDPSAVALLLGVSLKTLERYRRDGTGPAYFKPNRRTVRYRAGEVRAYVTGKESIHTTRQDSALNRGALVAAGKKGAAVKKKKARRAKS